MSSSTAERAAPASVGSCAPRFEKVRALFERQLREGEMGAAFCVTRGGEPVVDLWGGFADAARSRPWQPDTIVHTASTTKGMTALCFNRLVDEGRIDLEAPVARYWPEFAQAGKQRVPVEMLPTHRVGLPAIRRELSADDRYDWETMTSALAAEEPWWEPGSRHGYHPSTWGWLVGELVRRVDGRSLGTWFREEVARPLDVDFHIGVLPADDGRCAEMVRAPRRDGPRRRNKIVASMADPDSLVGRVFGNPPSRRDELNHLGWRRAEIPAANGHGSARGIARFYAALARGGELDGVRVISPGGLERATVERVFGTDEVLGLPTRFGLGFMLNHKHMPLGTSPGAFGHLGMGGCIGFADPELDLAVGYVMNQTHAGMAAEARGFALVRTLYGCLAS